MEDSPSPVYGAALLMRLGFTPLRGSNPRSSASDLRFPVLSAARRRFGMSGLWVWSTRSPHMNPESCLIRPLGACCCVDRGQPPPSANRPTFTLRRCLLAGALKVSRVSRLDGELIVRCGRRSGRPASAVMSAWSPTPAGVHRVNSHPVALTYVSSTGDPKQPLWGKSAAECLRTLTSQNNFGSILVQISLFERVGLFCRPLRR